MKKYEMVREIFNACSGNQMRDVFIDEIETDDMEATVKQFLVGTEVQCERIEKKGKGAIFNVNTDGLQQRITFTAV